MNNRLTIVFASAMLTFMSSISPTLALKACEQSFFKAEIQDTEIVNTINTKEILIAQNRRVFFRTVNCGKAYTNGRYWYQRCKRYRCVSYRRRVKRWNSRIGRYEWVWRWSRPSCKFDRRVTVRAWFLTRSLKPS